VALDLCGGHSYILEMVMNPITIDRVMLSEMVWRRLRSKSVSGLGGLFDELDGLREQANYNTGSLDRADVADLQEIVSHFKPVTVAEVGTFIGRSTAAMAKVMPEGGMIHTCDVSNDIKLPVLSNTVGVCQYPKQTSTKMFQSLVGSGTRVDLFYIDGRLAADDLPLIKKLMHDRTVFVLDDFVGVEKGVANAMNLLAGLGAPFYTLIYPRLMRKTAMLVPNTLLQFTAQ
jgi:hypothetical protein